MFMHRSRRARPSLFCSTTTPGHVLGPPESPLVQSVGFSCVGPSEPAIVRQCDTFYRGNVSLVSATHDTEQAWTRLEHDCLHVGSESFPSGSRVSIKTEPNGNSHGPVIVGSGPVLEVNVAPHMDHMGLGHRVT